MPSSRASSSMRQALVILPEAPYPAIGGGPLRTASILEALAEQFELTAFQFQLAGDPPIPFPPGLIRNTQVLRLPHHAKSFLPRLERNVRRALRGIPPLLDRFSGQQLEPLLEGRSFDLIWVEHFWLAPYAPLLRSHTNNLILDLHNIESAYYDSLASASPMHHRPLLRHFARCARESEQRLLPRFDRLVTTSEADAARLHHPNITVLPNTIPLHEVPTVPRSDSLAFTGNFAYTPNQQALRWFLDHIWPSLLRERPSLRLRLIGKEIHYAQSTAPNIDYIGPVDDAVQEIARSTVAIVPLRSGSGTRLKILEAFAASTPVVSTSIGAEGLNLTPGIHFLLADTPQSFTQSVLDLFHNESTRFHLAHEARRLYEDRFTWLSTRRMISEWNL